MSHYSGSIPDTTTHTNDWLADAPCKDDPEIMFSGSKHDIAAAKDICRTCPVTTRCLQWALDTGEDWGVWGGLSESERRALRRQAARPISIDEYAGTRSTRRQAATLQEVWDANARPEGEHVIWLGPKVVNKPGTKTQVTANRLAFYLDRGHWPEGDTKRTCGVQGCVKPSHLNDRVERAEEADLAVAV